MLKNNGDIIGVSIATITTRSKKNSSIYNLSGDKDKIYSTQLSRQTQCYSTRNLSGFKIERCNVNIKIFKHIYLIVI